jgi:hypothetical protein
MAVRSTLDHRVIVLQNTPESSFVIWISCYTPSVGSSPTDQSASCNAETCGAVSRNLETAQAMHALFLSPMSNSANRSNAVSWLGPISTDTSTRPCRRRSRCAWVRCRPCSRRWLFVAPLSQNSFVSMVFIRWCYYRINSHVRTKSSESTHPLAFRTPPAAHAPAGQKPSIASREDRPTPEIDCLRPSAPTACPSGYATGSVR